MKRLISKELFQFTLNHYKWYFSNHRDHFNSYVNSKIAHATHVPFYTVGLEPRSGLPVDKLLNGDVEPDAFDIRYGGQLWMSNPWYVKFLKECLSRRLYHIIFLSDATIDFKYNKDNIKSTLIYRAETAINKSCTTHFPKQSVSATVGTFQFMFDCMKLCNTFVTHNVKHGSTGDRKTYLTNMFFLAEYGTLSGHSPLIVGMVEKSRIVEARKCLINNSPIPTDLLELWVDSSVEQAGSKIKPLFRRYIKHGFENTGISIKTYPSLSKEIMFDVMPTVNTFEELRGLNLSLLNIFYDHMGGKCVTDYPEIYDSSHLEGIAKDIDEVLATIGD